MTEEAHSTGGEHHHSEAHHSHEHAISTGAIVIILGILFYMTMGSYIEKNHLSIGHEASFTIMTGMLVSYSLILQGEYELVKLLKFDENAFFFYCLPPIVFASGFNMQRGNFFANIKTVLLLGVCGTFIAFGSFSAMAMYVSRLGILTAFDGNTFEYENIRLSDAECLLMCSLLCSSDVIAAVSIVSYEKQPKLFSVVFGEGIMNDAVSIILFNTVSKYASANSDKGFQASDIGTIAGDFAILGMNSLMVGILFALMCAYILKEYRMFSHNPVAESTLIFCMGYLSYVTSEVAHYSGIISLLTCGIVMAHYAWYNLSPQGKQSSFIVFQFLGYATEAFVFVYLGLTFFSYSDMRWSPSLIAVMCGVILVGRALGTVGMFGFLKYVMRKEHGLSFAEQIFIWYAGMIRGAIAFGLVLRIDKKYENRDIIVTTSLSLVVITTVVCGMSVAGLQKCLFSTKGGEVEGEEANGVAINESESSSSESDSDYERIIHPNEDMTKSQVRKKQQGCIKYLGRFDELIMKPIFIYKYEKGMQKKTEEFFNLFMKEGKKIEKDFLAETIAQKVADGEESTLKMASVGRRMSRLVKPGDIDDKASSISKQMKKIRK